MRSTVAANDDCHRAQACVEIGGETAMKTIKVSEATNMQLNWLVAKAEEKETVLIPPQFYQGGELVFSGEYDWVGDAHVEANYTTNPSLMWPIIEREKMGVWTSDGVAWHARDFVLMQTLNGETSLNAAARCYVVSKLGETVKVPEEL